MGLLKRKPKVGIEEFCKNFYDTQVFQAMIGEIDVVPILWESLKGQLQEADESFAAIDQNLFKREMTALRLELFALAWMQKFKHEKYTIPQSIFTRRYLEEKGKLDIWDAMGEYNQALARSVALGSTGKPMEGRLGRGVIAFYNTLRWDMFCKWVEENLPEPSALTKEQEILANCVARVFNRIGVDIKQKNAVGAALVGAKLADRLECGRELSGDAIFKMVGVVLMLYDGAKEAIKSINLQR
jgi:hypothetical protein